MTYNPILDRCWKCSKPFEDGDVAFHWHEHYMCSACAEGKDLGSHIWRGSFIKMDFL